MTSGAQLVPYTAHIGIRNAEGAWTTIPFRPGPKFTREPAEWRLPVDWTGRAPSPRQPYLFGNKVNTETSKLKACGLNMCF